MALSSLDQTLRAKYESRLLELASELESRQAHEVHDAPNLNGPGESDYAQWRRDRLREQQELRDMIDKIDGRDVFEEHSVAAPSPGLYGRPTPY